MPTKDLCYTNSYDEVQFSKKDIMDVFFDFAHDSSTWIDESMNDESTKNTAVICLAEISGAARLIKNLFDEFDHVWSIEEAKDEDV